VLDAGNHGPLGPQHDVRRCRTLRQPPEPFAGREHVREPVARQQIHPYHGGQGEIGKWVGHADFLARQGRLATPLAREQPGARLVRDFSLTHRAAGFREVRRRDGAGWQSLGNPPLNGVEAGLALRDLHVGRRTHVRHGKNRDQHRECDAEAEETSHLLSLARPLHVMQRGGGLPPPPGCDCCERPMKVFRACTISEMCTPAPA
jgi:hypothetical protein